MTKLTPCLRTNVWPIPGNDADGFGPAELIRLHLSGRFARCRTSLQAKDQRQPIALPFQTAQEGWNARLGTRAGHAHVQRRGPIHGNCRNLHCCPCGGAAVAAHLKTWLPRSRPGLFFGRRPREAQGPPISAKAAFATQMLATITGFVGIKPRIGVNLPSPLIINEALRKQAPTVLIVDDVAAITERF